MNSQTSILIIDDNNQFQLNISSLFANQGYKTYTASDGNQGWEILQNHPIDLAIVDLIMPGKNGEWFIEQARDSTNYKDLPIIILTNLSHGENIGKIIVKGISRMLVKENTTDSELIQTVKEILK